ncbi:MAG TPA: serine/threonine-protein kinase [Gemmataceae bacterium]|nr:serine/threonine-protein kinase [Gemmataceae bacterium]
MNSPPGYVILERLGRGGMGVVYKARQVALDRVVALKMILHADLAGAAGRQRFRTEAEAVARLQHPNIIQIHEVGEQDGLPFVSMELCTGGSLADRIKAAPLPPADAARLVEVLARAMHVAHLKGVIHRDLKPANVLLGEDGAPKVGDFGLAKKLDQVGQTHSGAVLGTPSYMATEQAAGKVNDVAPAVDVSALGAVLYECLTGRPPFLGQHLNEPGRVCGFPGQLGDRGEAGVACSGHLVRRIERPVETGTRRKVRIPLEMTRIADNILQ